MDSHRPAPEYPVHANVVQAGKPVHFSSMKASSRLHRFALVAVTGFALGLISCQQQARVAPEATTTPRRVA
jgi:hypothetical protein